MLSAPFRGSIFRDDDKSEEFCRGTLSIGYSTLGVYPDTPEYTPEYDQNDQVWYPSIPEYMPEYDQNDQVWYPGIPEYYLNMAKTTRVSQSTYPSIPELYSAQDNAPSGR